MSQDVLFGSSVRTNPLWPDRPRVLMSYAYASKMTDDDFAGLDGCDIVIDSGAFTAHTTGKTVDHDAYLGFLSDHAPIVTFAFALDVIGDPAGSRANYAHAMGHLDRLPLIVPTWHVGSPMHVFDAYLDMTTYVAVGGAVPHYRQQTALHRLCRVLHDRAGEAGVKMHGLGMTGRRVMRRLPWASVDSSSWTIPARMPFLYLADEAGALVSINLGRPMPDWHKELIVHYGGTDPDAMESEGWAIAKIAGEVEARERKEWMVTACARSYMYTESAKRHHDGDGCDFRVYLATSPREASTIRAAHALGNPYITEEA